MNASGDQAMQDKRGPKVRSRKAANHGVVGGPRFDDVATQCRIAAELVKMMRNSGYECELLVEQDLH